MPEFDPVLSERAQAALRAAPPELRGVIIDHLYELCDDPGTLGSIAPTPPYPPGYQVYEFEAIASDATLHRYAILFKYMANESELWIHGIGHTEHPPRR